MTAFYDELADQVPDYAPGSFESCFPDSWAPKPIGSAPMVTRPWSTSSGGKPTLAKELSDAEQWQRDLETLDRIEQQMENASDLDFFDAMGGLMAARVA